MVDTEGRFDAGNVNATELGVVMWGATAAFTATIWFGAKWSRVIGGLMLTSYICLFSVGIYGYTETLT